jgi:anti-sigma regulatory factor (Ser/Thr protein kinase)
MTDGHAAETVATAGSTWLLRYARSYPGRADQVRRVRAFLREALADWPRADDAVALASELAANACLHSRSGIPGGMFTVRAEVCEGDYLYIAVQDEGGPWDPHPDDVLPQHGLDVVQAIAGPAHWGVSGDAAGRMVWARLPWPGTGQPASPAGAVAELEKLIPELLARRLAARLVIPQDGPPCLTVHAPGAPALAVKVYARAGWYVWPHSERIAACDDVSTAADTIVRALTPRCH